jgi:acyl-CoA synthetase (AMP-forming)/AMP-acid ligase II
MFPISFFATVCAGGVFAACAPNLLPSDAAYQLKLVQAKLVFCSLELVESAKQACEISGIPISKLYIVSSESGNHNIVNWLTGESLIEKEELKWLKITNTEILKDTSIINYFTSGTSGLPKYFPLFFIF